ncbi:hypothetical protein J1N35_017482 [Gossypium stocksii]|uniref:Uncharacterized protein n=1 Tax=Gossypium stocksii TaxID=47602 RepID=A0A9D3VNP2_9ROSI|nr:hypothetical protein J1N35_017482 [Gossypium stocksii]
MFANCGVIREIPNLCRFRRTKYGPKKEGHFAVVTVKGGEKKRFILELKYLRKPEFLGLLEQAKEEYEFQQEGVLILPSQPEELQNILALSDCF